MKVLVCGSRDYKDRGMVWSILEGFYRIEEVGWMSAHVTPFFLIEGGAKGADYFASQWATIGGPFAIAKSDGWWAQVEDEIIPFPDEMPKIHIQMKAHWDKYGRSAGPIRNRYMLDLKPDVVIGFSNDIQNSKGTKDCLGEAKKRGIKTILIGEF